MLWIILFLHLHLPDVMWLIQLYLSSYIKKINQNY